MKKSVCGRNLEPSFQRIKSSLPYPSGGLRKKPRRYFVRMPKVYVISAECRTDAIRKFLERLLTQPFPQNGACDLIMYINPSFGTKEELEEALKKGEEIKLENPGRPQMKLPQNGRVFVEGHNHRWYALVRMVDGKVKEVVK